jgi:hypothetical protein
VLSRPDRSAQVIGGTRCVDWHADKPGITPR